MRFFFWIFIFCCVGRVNGQQVTGKVVDNAGRDIAGATLVLEDSPGRKPVAFALSDSLGRFRLTLNHAGALSMLRIRHLAFKELVMPLFPLQQDTLRIQMESSVIDLPEVSIKVELPVVVRGDTTRFNVSAYAAADDRKLIDVLQKLPGFRVMQNGRLSFNGKEVEKLLIDGDDPAGEQYGMVTQNLEAELLSQIEVIDHFDENRLMKTVKSSDKVAVNLRLKPQYALRLSGTSELGLSTAAQKTGMLNLTMLHQRLKWLSFSSANNTGIDLGSQFWEYSPASLLFSEDGGTRGAFLLQTGVIPIPPLGERYTLRNNDQAAASLLSWKVGDHSRVSGQLGYSKAKRLTEQEHRTVTDPGGVTLWETQGKERRMETEQNAFSSLQFLRDKGGNRVSKGAFHLGFTSEIQLFGHAITGAIQDKLKEKLSGKRWLISADWTETIRAAGKIIRICGRTQQQQGQQLFETQTQRYLAVFQLDSTFSLYDQKSRRLTGISEVEIRINNPRAKQAFEYGWKLTSLMLKNSRHLNVQTGDSVNGPGRPPEWRNSRGINSKWFLLRQERIGNLRMAVELDGGISGGVIGQTRKIWPEWSSKISLNRPLSEKSGIRLVHQWVNGFSSWSSIFPDTLLSGNGSVLNGLPDLWIEEFHALGLSYRSTNLLRQRVSMMGITVTNNRDIIGPAIHVYPAYSLEGVARYSGQLWWQIILQHQFFVPLIRSRIQMDAQWALKKGDLRVNELLLRQWQQIGNMELRVVSGFRSAINGEAGLRLMFHRISRNRQLPGQNQQSVFTAKLKWTASEKVYAAGQWKWYFLSDDRQFHALDLYFSWKISDRLSARLEMVNALNSRAVEERRIYSYSESQTSFPINERYLMLTIGYRF